MAQRRRADGGARGAGLLCTGSAEPAGARRLALGGVPVRPERLGLPTFVALPQHDRIVPTASAEALAARLRDATVSGRDAGHVGMVVGEPRRTTGSGRRSWHGCVDSRLGATGTPCHLLAQSHGRQERVPCGRRPCRSGATSLGSTPRLAGGGTPR